MEKEIIRTPELSKDVANIVIEILQKKGYQDLGFLTDSRYIYIYILKSNRKIKMNVFSGLAENLWSLMK